MTTLNHVRSLSGFSMSETQRFMNKESSNEALLEILLEASARDRGAL